MRWLSLHSTRLVTAEGPWDVVGKPRVRNLYGCLPCPRCGGGYRYAVRCDSSINCGECGKIQRAVFGAGYEP